MDNKIQSKAIATAKAGQLDIDDLVGNLKFFKEFCVLISLAVAISISVRVIADAQKNGGVDTVNLASNATTK